MITIKTNQTPLILEIGAALLDKSEVSVDCSKVSSSAAVLLRLYAGYCNCAAVYWYCLFLILFPFGASGRLCLIVAFSG